MNEKKLQEDERNMVELPHLRSNWKEEFSYELRNKEAFDFSRNIIFKVLQHLSDNKITKRDFADLMEVSEQAIGKMLNGRQCLELPTIFKMQRKLGIMLMPIESNAYSNVNIAWEKQLAVPKTVVESSVGIYAPFTEVTKGEIFIDVKDADINPYAAYGGR